MRLPRHAELWLVPYVADRCTSAFGESWVSSHESVADDCRGSRFEPLRGQEASLATGLERTMRVWKEAMAGDCAIGSHR